MTAATTTAPDTTDTIAVIDPSTGEEIGTIPAGSATAADTAARAAREIGRASCRERV